MRPQKPVGFSVLAATGALAVALGLHGAAHPGPLPGPGGGFAAGAAPGGHVAAGAARRGSSSQPSKAGGGSPAPSHRLLLSQSPYAPYALPIYPGRLSAAAQTALDGFTLTVQPMAKGQVQLTLVLAGASGPPYRHVMPATDRAYFIEGNMGDDAPGEELNLGDDGILYTDAKGYILQ